MGKKAPKVAAVAPVEVEKTEAEIAAEALEKQVDASTTAPEGVAVAKEEAPAGPAKVENKDGVKSIKATGHFVAVGNLIFNRMGAHVGTEENERDAARKADRFNGLTR